MNDLNQKLIITLVVIPILLGIFRTPKEMGIAVAAIGLALFFANIDKFSRFKGAGFEAELRIAVDEAYAAIVQLKELGLSLSAPIVDELALSGRISKYIPLKYKLNQVSEIANTLKKLGASQKEIDEVCSNIYDQVTNDHTSSILHALKIANPEKKDLFEGINDGKMYDWDKSKIEKFINEHNLTKSDDTNEWFLDLDYFLKQRKLRREDKWQN